MKKSDRNEYVGRMHEANPSWTRLAHRVFDLELELFRANENIAKLKNKAKKIENMKSKLKGKLTIAEKEIERLHDEWS